MSISLAAPLPNPSNRRPLDVVSQLADALFVVDPDGSIRDVPTPRAEEFFPGPYGRPVWRDARGAIVGVPVWDALYSGDPAGAVAFEMNFSQIADAFLPFEMLLDQMPQQLRRDGRIFRIEYFIEADEDDTVHAVLIKLTDRTAFAEEDAQNASNAEFRTIIQSLLSNIDASRAFFAEAEWLLDQLSEEADEGTLKRVLHTLKGNLGVFGFHSVAKHVHVTEDRLVEGNLAAVHERVSELRELWAELARTYGELFSADSDEIIVNREEYEDHVMSLMCQLDYAELLGVVQKWSMAPVSRVFAGLKMQAERIGNNLGRAVLVEVEHNNVRLPNSGLQELWSSLPHLLRNALEHGVEDPDERTAAGKAEKGTITLKAETTEDDVILHFGDDGRGIDWDRIRVKAAKLGLPTTTPEELATALLSEGVTSRDQVSQTSGRGVGTSAVASAVERLGGRVEVSSETGKGTTFTLFIPLAALATLGLLS